LQTVQSAVYFAHAKQYCKAPGDRASRTGVNNMTTVTIYLTECTKAYQMYEQHGPSASLRPWGDNTSEYEGRDDGGAQYVLPDGFSVDELISGEQAIFKGDDHYALATIQGKPALIGGQKYEPIILNLV
jgi:hypothetical protein